MPLLQPLTQRGPYHRRSRTWEHALRQLHALGLSDQLIADAMNDLDKRAIAILDLRGWTRARVESLMVVNEDNPQFTRRIIHYHRKRLGLHANPYEREIGRSQADLVAFHRGHRYASVLGWNHLCNRSHDIRAALQECQRTRPFRETQEQRYARVAQLVGPGWTGAMIAAWVQYPWNDLRKTEADILTALNERPLTRPQLAERLQLSNRRWRSNGRSYLGHLLRAGLIVIARHEPTPTGRLRVYTLAPGVGTRHRSPWDTAGERGAANGQGLIEGWGYEEED